MSAGEGREARSAPFAMSEVDCPSLVAASEAHTGKRNCLCTRCCHPDLYAYSGSDINRLTAAGSERAQDGLAGLIFGSGLSGMTRKEGEGAADWRTPLGDGIGGQVGFSDTAAVAGRHRKPFVSRCWVLDDRASNRRHPPMAFQRAMLILEACLRDDLVSFR